MEAFMKEEWKKIDFSGLTFADSDDEQLQACTVTLGALPPRIRLPVLETQGEIDIVPIRGREKTEEDVDQEIIAFLCHLRNMDPQPQVTHQRLFLCKPLAASSLVITNLLVDISIDNLFACMYECCSF